MLMLGSVKEGQCISWRTSAFASLTTTQLVGLLPRQSQHSVKSAGTFSLQLDTMRVELIKSLKYFSAVDLPQHEAC